MSHGTATATSASTALVAADFNRKFLLIQHTNATQVALGIGIAAESGKGIQLYNIGDVVLIKGWAATQAIYGIGNNGTITYQDMEVEYYPGSKSS